MRSSQKYRNAQKMILGPKTSTSWDSNLDKMASAYHQPNPFPSRANKLASDSVRGKRSQEIPWGLRFHFLYDSGGTRVPPEGPEAPQEDGTARR